ncbi:efflux RND transporter periplasmic adaptor subunit [Mesorhizobium retamae]|uniref:Efflux RND transporter periplasmic adaptor subunit n=1 Tax=Mesorhizobium retamae TaxID=2912854 RepID=A0ABS9QIX9_9HYPH|nr:efflux RND transporter periplasmic adaptor subunit [Mesorhizobium sp. IRAMC:0171]MCG7506803.1 efflux RND transporter periplasmic adaptor subunit [Mesorhizobium sp. IRAMC:0171]
MTVRNKALIGLIGGIVVVAAGAFLWPTGASKVWQMLPFGEKEVAAKAAAGGNNGENRAQGGGRSAVTVATATAKTTDFPIQRYAIGFLASPAVANINARVASQVMTIAVEDGQMVKQGDVLITLDDRALKAQVEKDKATLAKDQALAASAAADLERAKSLLARQTGTQQAYDQALAAQKAAQATVAADQAALDADLVQLGYTTITAPISGRLGAVSVSVGDLVTAGGASGTGATPLVTITEMDPLRVAFNLPEADLALLQQATAKPGSVSVTLHKDGSPEPIGSGTVDFVNSTVDTASGTITARATVPNADLKLWPGQYVNVTVNAGTMPQVVTVPTQAVQPSQQGSFVYVVKADKTVEARPIKVAISHENESAIASGLKDGEKVVVDGQLSLKPGSAVREVDGGGSGGASESTAPKAADKANGNETAG